MKKALYICLVVALCIGAVLGCVHLVNGYNQLMNENKSDETVEISGVWQFNESLQPYAIIKFLGSQEHVHADVSFTSNGRQFAAMGWIYVSVSSDKHATKSLDFVVPRPQGDDINDSSLPDEEWKDFSEDAYTTNMDRKPYIVDLWHIDAFRIVDFGSEPQLVNKHFYDWFTANASPIT